MTPAFGNPVKTPIIAYNTAKPAGGDTWFRVTQTFANPDAYWRAHGKPNAVHGALDLGDHRCGSPVIAARGGTVAMAATLAPEAGNDGAKVVKIDHGDGWTTEYWHLGRYTVTKGQTVGEGSLVGYVGSTGNTTMCHLHWEVKHNGVQQDPWPLLRQNGAKDEDNDVKIKGKWIGHIINKRTTITASGAWFRSAPTLGDDTKIAVFPGGTGMYPREHVESDAAGGATPNEWYSATLWVNGEGWTVGYFHSSVLGPLVDVIATSGVPEEKYNADLLAARKDGGATVAKAADARAKSL